ncbi:FAD-dependent oxidoreductase [bacterium]|nr:FAD-dependent oxidoreductase [bacterium]
MQNFTLASFILALALSILPLRCLAAEPPVFDIVVYGGTSAAVTTAVQAKAMGKSVVIVCPEKHLGGMTSGGLGWTDSGDKDAIGGLARNFYHRIWKYYQADPAWKFQKKAQFGNKNQSPPGKSGDGATMWVFEPHVAESVFEDLIRENAIPVHRGKWLDRTPGQGVILDKGRIRAIRMTDDSLYRGRMFVDATYEGDLMAAAGVKYHVGRESNATYDETWNGNQVGILHHKHHFANPVDPYRTPGDPASGLLPLIDDSKPGTRGEADDRLQAYCFRLCMTDHDPNRMPFPKPEGYDPARYELLLRVFATGWRELFEKYDPIPNFKTDTNNHGPVSSDFLGANYDYPEASYERRAGIVREHEKYQKGLLYFMANEPRVPADVREAVSKWGLAKDEFKDNGHWPHQIYVREARRMLGRYVMTEHDCLDKKATPDSIGMGSYTVDSHNVRRYVTPEGTVQNEGDIGVPTPRPYEIALGSILPHKNQCENLLVPVCVSASHIAYGSIRMEPVFMILGQSAATVAALAIDRDSALQDVPYDLIKKRLLADGQVLELEDTKTVRATKLPGIVIDDEAAKLTGDWKRSNANRPFVESGYRHNGNSKEPMTAVFETKLPAGLFDVRFYYPPNSNRATNVAVNLRHAGGITKSRLDQQEKPTDGLYTSLGNYRFDGEAVVTVETRGADGFVVIDAVQFVPVPEP